MENAMKNITLAVDDALLDQARIVAAENRTTVNAMVRTFLMQTVARRRLVGLEKESSGAFDDHSAASRKNTPGDASRETTHQKMQRILDEGRAKYADRKWFDREETYDRDYQRAEGYFENRAALLKLIDETTADMGTQEWNREALYER
jgi:hypothetical protein